MSKEVIRKAIVDWDWNNILASVVQSVTDPTKYGLVICNPDWSPISWWWGWSWDVVWPASSINNRVVFFDWITGKLIKDSWLTLSWTNTGDQDLTPYFNKSVDDTDDITEWATNKFATATEKTKLWFISVTQAVDLDTIETNANNVPWIKSKTDFITVTQPVDLDQMETDIAALANGMVYKGNWDASVWTFPWAWSAKIWRFYTVSVGWTVDWQAFNVWDRLIAIVNNASTTTFAWNWSILDATDAVTSVFGRTGNVVAQAWDYTKSDVWLGNVDNTSDLNKPVSTATQTALNLKADDSNVVHKTGNETIAWDKTFQDKIIQTVATGEVPYEVNDWINTYFQIRATWENALVIGNEAGTWLWATEINNNIVWYQAWYWATGSSDTQMIGNQAWYWATNSTASNFIWPGAWASSTDTTLVTYIGTAAGNGSSNSTYSTYIGNNAWLLASGTTDSIYVGRDTWRSATNTTSGIFIGKEAGRWATWSNYSTLIWHQAWKQFTGNNIGTNNIIIGTNVSLPNTTTNSLNIWWAIQATWLYSTTTGNPSTSPVAGAKVWIWTNTPSEKLHVIWNILSSGTIVWSNLSGNNTWDISLTTTWTSWPATLVWQTLNIPQYSWWWWGEVNTASNIGTAGVWVFKQKTGVNLEFKKINAWSTKVTITDDTANNEVDIDVSVTKADVWLSNVDNTSDADKPVSTATATALSNKQNIDAWLTSISALTWAWYVKATATDTFTMQSTIPNSDLANSSITIAWASVALGWNIVQDTITGLSSLWIIKRTAANTLAIAVAWTDYVSPNAAITWSTKTKITYDSKGLVTAWADATQDDIADGVTNRSFTNTEKTKLAWIATWATANSSDATLLNRANHTGTQTSSTISDFDSATRAQTEAELVAGSNITITPSWSWATRQLTISSTGWWGWATITPFTVNIWTATIEHEVTVTAAWCTPSSNIIIQNWSYTDDDENWPEIANIAFNAVPWTWQFTFRIYSYLWQIVWPFKFLYIIS